MNEHTSESPGSVTTTYVYNCIPPVPNRPSRHAFHLVNDQNAILGYNNIEWFFVFTVGPQFVGYWAISIKLVAHGRPLIRRVIITHRGARRYSLGVRRTDRRRGGDVMIRPVKNKTKKSTKKGRFFSSPLSLYYYYYLADDTMWTRMRPFFVFRSKSLFHPPNMILLKNEGRWKQFPNIHLVRGFFFVEFVRRYYIVRHYRRTPVNKCTCACLYRRLVSSNSTQALTN